AQGPNAIDGAYGYMIGDRMTGGFALVAYPADRGNSGVMTFIVNHDGIVYSKDLGDGTAKVAEQMTTFDPDPSWKREDAGWGQSRARPAGEIDLARYSSACPLRSGRVKISTAASRKNTDVEVSASPMPTPGQVAITPTVYGASAPRVRPKL